MAKNLTGKSNILTESDINNLFSKFCKANQSYFEIVNTAKNQSTIDKYPLIKDISLSILDNESNNIYKSTY